MYICLWSPHSLPLFVQFGANCLSFPAAHVLPCRLACSNPSAPTPYSHQPTYLHLLHLRLSCLLETAGHLFDLLFFLQHYSKNPVQPTCSSESQYQRFLPPFSSAAWPRPVPSPARTSVYPHHVFFFSIACQHVADIWTTVKARSDSHGHPRARGMLFLRHLQGRRRRPGRMSQPSIVTHIKFHFFGGRKISCGFLHAFFFWTERIHRRTARFPRARLRRCRGK